MAATGRNMRWASLIIPLLITALPVRADRESDVRAQLTYVASALASHDPIDALLPFAKTLAGYDKLRSYFGALTNSFDVVSEIEIVDEDDAEAETILKVSWALQLVDRMNDNNLSHTYDATIHFKRSSGKWKIISFTPVEMFNPQLTSARGK